MLTPKDLKENQHLAMDRLFANNSTLLVAPTGAGKTVICLTVVKEMLDDCIIKRVIVACPARVVSVWKREAAKWSHLKDLNVVELKGDAEERGRAFLRTADVYVVSLNNLDWALGYQHGCNGIVIDELSKAAGKQARGLRSKVKGDCFTWRVGMTATPVSQDFVKLYAMCRIIDRGKALGTNKQKYLDRYFYSDYLGYNWTLRAGSDTQIMGRIAPLLHVVEDTKKSDLPGLLHHVIRFEMPEATRVLYEEMKKDMVVGDVEAANAAVQSGKLRQLASGFLYEEGVDYNSLDHGLDLARVDEALGWVTELGERKGVIFYEYKAQLDDLYQLPCMTTDVGGFIDGEGQLLLAQVSSLSHGIDGIQDVCSDALFYHPMWSRDATEQAEGRLWRTGQKHPVNITTIVCDDTLDDVVMKRVKDRGEFMKMFLKHLKG